MRSRRGASFLVLSAIRQRVIAGVLSSALFLEYADVLKRDQNVQQFWTTPEEIDVVLGVLADVLKPVPIYFQWRPPLRDPNDEMVLECAINAQASAIVTFNERDFLPAAQQFGIEVIQPLRVGAIVKFKGAFQPMSSYPLQLPEELMQEVRRLAEVNQVPVEQWLIAAIARHVAAFAISQSLVACSTSR